MVMGGFSLGPVSWTQHRRPVAATLSGSSVLRIAGQTRIADRPGGCNHAAIPPAAANGPVFRRRGSAFHQPTQGQSGAAISEIVIGCPLKHPSSHRPEPAAMKTTYDAEADALYVRFSETPVVESEEVSNGVILDFDADGRIVAIELLDASKQVAADAKLTTAAE
jgi:uncharacterized protein YuzE